MLFAGREHPSDNFFSGKRREGERTKKFLGGARHYDLHADAAILQQADNFGSLVSRNAASHTQSNLHINLMVNCGLSIPDCWPKIACPG